MVLTGELKARYPNPDCRLIQAVANDARRWDSDHQIGLNLNPIKLTPIAHHPAITILRFVCTYYTDRNYDCGESSRNPGASLRSFKSQRMTLNQHTPTHTLSPPPDSCTSIAAHCARIRTLPHHVLTYPYLLWNLD